jgi:hypothetical protein
MNTRSMSAPRRLSQKTKPGLGFSSSKEKAKPGFTAVSLPLTRLFRRSRAT